MQGIDKEEFEHLNESLIQPVDQELFESGKVLHYVLGRAWIFPVRSIKKQG